MKFEGFPLIVGWELTLQCNLRCRHCGSSAGHPRDNELTTEEALSICDQLPELLVQEVDFTGGEPYLRKDLPVIAGRLRDLGINTNILTHGYGYSDENIGIILDAGISGAGISLDGVEDTHDYIRRSKGSFTSVMNTIHLMQQKNLPYNVITTVNSRNINELPAMCKLLIDKGVEFWRLQGIIPMGRVVQSPELRLSEQNFKQLGLFIQEQRETALKQGLNIICSDGLQYIAPAEKKWQGCGAGIVTCGITADGRIKGCLSMSDELTEGNLRERSLWEIWFNKESFAYNRKYAQSDLGENCRECDMAGECKGGCTSSSFAMNGTFHNDPYCFYRIHGEKKV